MLVALSCGCDCKQIAILNVHFYWMQSERETDAGKHLVRLKIPPGDLPVWVCSR